MGGGTAGITTAAQLKRKHRDLDVAIVEPSDVHYYQPLWTLVGGGLFRVSDSQKPLAGLIPKQTRWIQDAVASFDPARNQVTLASGAVVGYDFLVVAAGLQLNLDGIKGLREHLGRHGVCTIYLPEQCEYVWDTIQRTRHGTALFTMPSGPVKCGGAPQKIMYLAEDHFRDQQLRTAFPPLSAGAPQEGPDAAAAAGKPGVRVIFAPAGPSMFGVAYYAPALDELRRSKGIEAWFSHELVEVMVEGESKRAVFKTPAGGQRVIEFDMLHVVPPMMAPPCIKTSALADASGFVEVDKETTQHKRFPNVFSIGDCSNLPTSKTAAAVASQVPVLIKNLQCVMQGQAPVAKYDGYTSCPLVTGKNSLMLLEFLYGGEPTSTFGLDNRVPRYPYFLLKKYVFPLAYWHLMLKGLWYGRHHVIHPSF